MNLFAPVGNGRVLAYVFTSVGEGVGYVRGTNILRIGDTRYAAVGDEIASGEFDLPPLAGATRAAVVDRIPDLADRRAVQDLYARSVLVIAMHQELSGAFIAEKGEDVLMAHALDVCGERPAAEAFFEWALRHRGLDGVLMWGLGEHVRLVHGTGVREPYERLRDGPGPELAPTPPAMPDLGRETVVALLSRRNSLDLLVDGEGVDLAAHAAFLMAVHALVPKIKSGEDFFFGHQGLAHETRRARALYAGAFHGGMVAAGHDPAREVEIRPDLEPAAIAVEPAPDDRYRIKVDGAWGSQWASDSIPRPGGQEFAYGTTEGPPGWIPDAVVYQVMVDRFAREDGPLPAPGSSTALYGGTLDGVRAHLDHISGLGCNVIWLTPIHKSPTHHGYDIEDFYAVEPRYGGEAALKRLIGDAHRRGMRVLLDFVPNHTARGNSLFRDAITHGGDATEFYRFWQWPHYYRCFGDTIVMPELDTGSRRVQRYLVEAARHWLTDYGADGLRCDHVAGVDPAFWIELRKGLRAVKPDALILGEATGQFDWLARYAGRVDAIFDFDFAHMVRQTFARGVTPADEFARWLDAHDSALPGLGRATLLDNHDMNRFLWMAGGDRRKLELAATLLMTLPGMPVIYYGTEVGLSQRWDAVIENAEARLPMLWGADQDLDLYAFFQRLGRLRNESVALRRGSRRTLRATGDQLVYERVLGEERVVVSLNLSTLSGSIVDSSGRDRLSEDDVLGVSPDQRPR